MAVPFSVRAQENPVQAAALQGLRENAGASAPAAPTPTPAPGVAPTEALPGAMNPVAEALTRAWELFLQRGGRAEDLAAIQQFLGLLEQFAGQQQGQLPPGQATLPPETGAPVAAPPVPVPQGGALPPG